MRFDPLIRPRLFPRIAILLATTLVFGAIATPAVAVEPPTCSEPVIITGPGDIYAVAGLSLADHQYTTDPAEPMWWSSDSYGLPAGVTFDNAAARYVGTPEQVGIGAAGLTATDSCGQRVSREIRIYVLSADALAFSITGAEGAEIDLTALNPGSPFEVRSDALIGDISLPVGTVVTASWGAATFAAQTLGDVASFVMDGAVPSDAASGDHTIYVDFQLPNGQHYSSREVVGVINLQPEIELDLSGPATIHPVVGINTVYTYAAVGASAEATYSLQGDLPAGLVFNPDTAEISGIPESVVQVQAVIYVTDGARSDGMEVAIEVLPGESLDFPQIVSPININADLGNITSLLSSLGSLDDGIALDKIDELIEASNAETSATRQNKISIGVNPTTGDTFIFLGSQLEQRRHQNSMLFDAATVAAEDAKREQVAQLERERTHRQEAEMLAQEALKLQNDQLKAKLLAQLERQKAAKVEAAEAAKRKAESALAEMLVNEEAKRALAQRQIVLQERQEEHPLPAGTTIRAELHSTPVLLGTETVGESGGFLLRAAIPANTTPGGHSLVMTYTLPDGATHTQALAVTIVDESTSPRPADESTLAATGADAAPLGYAGMIFLMVGMMALVTRRRLEVKRSL